MATPPITPVKKAAKAVKAVKAVKAAKAPSTGATAKAKTPKPATSPRPVSTAGQMEILRLGKGSHSIELKLSIPANVHRETLRKLKLDPVEAQPRQVYFFDTPNLDLSKAGVVVRARRIQGGRADTVIKLRPVDPEHLDPELRRSPSFKVEVDIMPGGFVCSASLKGACTGNEVLDVTEGALPLKSLFSKEQRAFYAKHAPAGLPLESLATLGPTFLLKSKHLPKDFDRAVTVEMWLYPDGSRILEISSKCLPAEVFQFIVEMKGYLARCGIEISEGQGTKTKAALEFFSKQLREAA